LFAFLSLDVLVNKRKQKHSHENKSILKINKKSKLKDTKKHNDNLKQNNFSASTVSTSTTNKKLTNMKQEKTIEKKNNPVNPSLEQIRKIKNKSRDIQKNYDDKKKMILKDSALNNSPSIIKDVKTCISESVPYSSFYQTKTLKSILRKNQHIQNHTNNTNKSQIAQIANNKTEETVPVPKDVSNHTQLSSEHPISEPKKDVTTSTINESNNEIQKITAQNTESSQMQEKPIRKKLNLAEYRNRLKHNNSNNSAAVIYVNHISTTTEAFKHNPDNPVWVEKFTVLEHQLERKIKPLSHDKEVQTDETSFIYPKGSIIDFTKHEK